MAAQMMDNALREIADSLELQCTKRVQRLREQMTEELAGFEAAAARIDAELAAFEGRVSQTVTEFELCEEEATEQIASRQDNLGALVQQVEAEIDTREEALHVADDAMSGAFDEMHSSLEAAKSTCTSAAESLAADFHAWADKARQSFGKADGSLQALSSAAAEFIAACTQSANDLVSRFAEVSHTLDLLNDRRVNDWLQAQTALGDGTQQMLVGHVAQELQREIHKLQDVLGTLRGGADGAASVLGDDAMRLIASLRDVGKLLEQVEPLLRVVDELA